MNEFIATVTSPGTRKYLYRVAWALALVLVASGKLDSSQLEVALGLVAAVLAVADSQTSPNSTIGDTSEAWADGVLSGLQIADDVDPVLSEGDPEWQPLSEIADSDIQPLED